MYLGMALSEMCSNLDFIVYYFSVTLVVYQDEGIALLHELFGPSKVMDG